MKPVTRVQEPRTQLWILAFVALDPHLIADTQFDVLLEPIVQKVAAVGSLRPLRHEVLVNHLVHRGKSTTRFGLGEQRGMAKIEEEVRDGASRHAPSGSVSAGRKSECIPRSDPVVEVSATPQGDTSPLTVSLSDLINQCTPDPSAPKRGRGTEMDDLDAIPREVEKNITDDLVVDSGHQERAGRCAIGEALVGHRSESCLCRPVQYEDSRKGIPVIARDLDDHLVHRSPGPIWFNDIHHTRGSVRGNRNSSGPAPTRRRSIGPKPLHNSADDPTLGRNSSMSPATGSDAVTKDELSGLTPHDLVAIEITYKTDDRYGSPNAGPNDAYAQRIYAEIEGLTDDWERRVPLGFITLARIDIWEAGGRLLDVLDAESGEWTAYAAVLDSDRYDPHALLIVDRAEIEPWARGYGIGLNAVARAIRTWGSDAVVALTAFPPGGSGAKGKVGSEKLRRYWSQLG